MKVMNLGLAILAIWLLSCEMPERQHGRLELSTVMRHHDEVVSRPSGEVLPMFLGAGSSMGVCLETNADLDTSQWRGQLTVDGRLASDGSPPAARSGRVLCFDGEMPEGLEPSVELDVCLTIEDRFDGRRWPALCQPSLLMLELAEREAIEADKQRLLAEAKALDVWQLVGRLEQLAARAVAAGLPMQAARLELIAVYFLRREGGPEAIAKAQQLLSQPMSWQSHPAAGGLSAQIELERAALELAVSADDQAAKRAWLHLSQADALFRRSAHRLRLSATIRRTALLARLGFTTEAVEQLQSASQDCATAHCLPAVQKMASSQLAWLVLQDPFARQSQLAAAEADLRALLEPSAGASNESLEHANEWLNLAYLQVRQGLDSSAARVVARGLIAKHKASGRRADELNGWASVLDGLVELTMGQAQAALEACAAVTSAVDAQLAAGAAACEGRALRRLGQLDQAAATLGDALHHHGVATQRPTSSGFAQGPGPRAEAFKHLARVEIERGRPEKAWQLMAELDGLAFLERDRQTCRLQATTPEVVERWRAIERESDGILDQLARADPPTSVRRRQQVQAMRRELRARWRTLQRDWPGCELSPGVSTGEGFRAFTVEDEVILLRRSAAGEVTLEQRTTLSRQRLLEIVDGVSRAMISRDQADATWRAELAPLAAALVPKAIERWPEVSLYRLHGALQGVPLAALPLPEGSVGGTENSGSDGAGSDGPGSDRAGRWLVDVTVPALVGVGSRPLATPAATGPGVFLIDPDGSLPEASTMEPYYRQQFPLARILAGANASRVGVRSALTGSGWLHVDAHGRYEDSFPELSAMVLHDGQLAWPELAALASPWRFANLSGCQTGSSQWTPDSGRFGLAGLLTQVGVRWVVASRANLLDRFAAEFNRTFYAALADGNTVPEAHGRALRSLARRYPVSVWAAMMIVSGAVAPDPPPSAAVGDLNSSIDVGGKHSSSRILSKRRSAAPDEPVALAFDLEGMAG